MKRLTPTRRGGIECPIERSRAHWRKEKGASHGAYSHRRAQEGKPDLNPGRAGTCLSAGFPPIPASPRCWASDQCVPMDPQPPRYATLVPVFGLEGSKNIGLLERSRASLSVKDEASRSPRTGPFSCSESR